MPRRHAVAGCILLLCCSGTAGKTPRFAEFPSLKSRVCPNTPHIQFRLRDDTPEGGVYHTLHLADCSRRASIESCAIHFGDESASACADILAVYVGGLEALALARKAGPVLDMALVHNDDPSLTHYVEVYHDCEATWGSELEWRLQQGSMANDGVGLRADYLHLCRRGRGGGAPVGAEAPLLSLEAKANALNVLASKPDTEGTSY